VLRAVFRVTREHLPYQFTAAFVRHFWTHKSNATKSARAIDRRRKCRDENWVSVFWHSVLNLSSVGGQHVDTDSRKILGYSVRIGARIRKRGLARKHANQPEDRYLVRPRTV